MRKSVLIPSRLLLLGGADAVRTINVAKSVPKGSSDPVDPSFPALAFETSSFYNYAMEDGRPNTFSQNLINAIFSRPGDPPVLRVPASRPATQGGPAFGKPFLILGPSYWKAYDSFPNAMYLFMVPFHHYWGGHNERLQNMLAWAEQGLKVIGNRLHALEIGNEPDFYKKGRFDANKYIAKFNAVEKALVNRFPQTASKLQALDKAFNPPVAVPVSAVRDKLNGVKQYAYHYYQHYKKFHEGDLANQIMNHARTVNAMRPFASKVRYWKKKGRPIRILMDEVDASMSAGEGHNNLGSALWLADYLLHNMAIGITRVHYQQIVAPGFNLWQPVKSMWTGQMVRPNFYAMPFAADFIGGSNTRVHGIKIPNSKTLAAYTAWENGKLARIAIINLNHWKAGQGNRPNADFKIRNLKAKSARIEYLTASGGATAEKELSWSGLEWTASSNGKGLPFGKKNLTRDIKNSVLTVEVPSSSAMIINLNCEFPCQNTTNETQS